MSNELFVSRLRFPPELIRSIVYFFTFDDLCKNRFVLDICPDHPRKQIIDDWNDWNNRVMESIISESTNLIYTKDDTERLVLGHPVSILLEEISSNNAPWVDKMSRLPANVVIDSLYIECDSASQLQLYLQNIYYVSFVIGDLIVARNYGDILHIQQKSDQSRIEIFPDILQNLPIHILYQNIKIEVLLRRSSEINARWCCSCRSINNPLSTLKFHRLFTETQYSGVELLHKDIQQKKIPLFFHRPILSLVFSFHPSNVKINNFILQIESKTYQFDPELLKVCEGYYLLNFGTKDPFRLDPDDPFDGTLNFHRLNNVWMIIDYEANEESDCCVYATSINLLRCAEPLFGVVFY